jgi:60 kDa SS-A/Ro ribonucleoprotein
MRTNRFAVAPPIPEPTILNYEGFPAFERTIEERVIQVLTTGSTANTFYVSGKENIEQIVNVCKECEPDFLSKALVYAREEGFTRTAPILGLAVLSTKNSSDFHRVASRVCKNPRDWKQLIDACLAEGDPIRKGMGRAIKDEIIKALASMSEYHAIKYPSDVRDMIRTARPREGVNRSVIKYIMAGETGDNGMFRAVEALKEERGPAMCESLVRDHKLPYEVVSGMEKAVKHPGVWTALFENAPHFNLVRNINTFQRHGVFADAENIKSAVSRIMDAEAIKKAKLFPFRYYVAWANVKGAWGLSAIGNALKQAVELSALNVPLVPGRVVISTDISGSMSSHVMGDDSVLQCIDVAALFSAILKTRCDMPPLLLPCADSIDWTMAQRAMDAEGILKTAECYDYHGGTSLSAPVEHLLRNRIVCDKYIAFTDNMQWVGRSFLDAFLQYKRMVAPKCQAYLVTLMPYDGAPAPPQIEDVHFIYGWSDNILKYVTMSPDAQVRAVRESV